MVISRADVADKLTAFLHHEVSLSELVDWAESAMMDAEFEEAHFDLVRDLVARLGVADVRTFGLTRDECEQMLRRLGYSVHLTIEVV